MRTIIGIVLWAAAANPALAHTLDGDIVPAIEHQLFGAHHLMFTVALVAFAYYLGRLWRRRDRT